MEKVIKIYCDGGARGNPGPSASAFVVIKDGKIVYKSSKYLGIRTNNFAEYTAVIMGLSWLSKDFSFCEEGKIKFILDSQLVVRQLRGEYRVKSESLRKLFKLVILYREKIPKEIFFIYTSRTNNRMSDRLVNQELDTKS